VDNKDCLICDQKATPKTDYCKKHGGTIARWKHRSPSHVLRYRDALRTRTAYMGVIVDIKAAELKRLKAYTK
jgi:hypothetical protein